MESGPDSAGGSPAASSDLSTKYQKIAAEYAKARLQVQVLKKAVIDEQKINSELKEALRQLEQSSRKSEQEIDSLAFRNQQLTRRVAVLQDELEMQQYNKKKKNKAHDEHHNSEFTNHVIDEEFRKKITENEELLSTMHEKEEAHSQEVVTLSEQVERIRRQLELAQKTHSESEEKYKNTIAKLEREKLELREGREGLELAAEELSELRRTHTQYKTEMDSQLTSAQTIIATHLPFVDSSNAELNGLNIPRFLERNRQSVPRSLVQQVCSELEEAAGALAEFHLHSALRLESLSHPQALNQKYLSLLKESSQLASELRRGLSDVGPSLGDDKLDTKTAFQKIPNLLASYCTHLETFMPFLRIALEDEESHLSDDDSKACNDQVALVTSQFVNHCVQLNSIVTLISKQKNVCRLAQGWQMRHEQELVDIFYSIHEDSKDMLCSYVSKFDKESSKNRNENLSLTNTYITSALSRFMDSTGKVLSGLKQMSRAKSTPKTEHPAVADLSKRAAHYFNCLETEESQSVPYLEALKDLEEARNGIELRRGLKRQLEETQADLIKINQECEHWKNEYKLLSNINSTNNDESEVPHIATDTENSVVTNMIGSLSPCVNFPEEAAKREDSIKEYFRDRISQLIAEKQEAESRAATFSNECSALARRLEASLEAMNKAENNLQEMREKVVHLQEELATTASSYEAQLSTMSDHLATMNERLASQRETIDHLQFQMNSKGNKKGRK
ncbi:hypothetical protein LSTR_LSTR004421 [Laodelphax striatellus]|uniref:Protein phosphatase 1 regulatory subunit 21 N-terminal domain-containing protein n=1 Tax=Laodelphax striatellus TaxID=195883 RepID=A0A482XA09_LAOST|nr:hypothetical protein LSTR_LSTR004421 [Laodelphax striatellus]